MKNKLHVAALIPMRGGSKGIPNKNIKEFCGKPLFYWAVSAALSSKYIDEVYVSTESEEIKGLVTKLFPGVKIVDRPIALAQDGSSTEEVLLHFSDLINFDVNVTIQVTSPIVKAKDFDAALCQYFECEYDSLLSVVKTKRFFWNNSAHPINYNYKERPRRQDFDGAFMENGAFYITSKKVLVEDRCRLGGVIGMYEMHEEAAYEIDTMADWKIVEMLMHEHLKRGKLNK